MIKKRNGIYTIEKKRKGVRMIAGLAVTRFDIILKIWQFNYVNEWSVSCKIVHIFLRLELFTVHSSESSVVSRQSSVINNNKKNVNENENENENKTMQWHIFNIISFPWISNGRRRLAFIGVYSKSFSIKFHYILS